MKNCASCPDLQITAAAVIYPQCFKPGCPKQKKFELKVVQLVNTVRKKAGLRPLIIDSQLTKAAREKSQDMAVNKYFSHESPTYGTPLELITSFGVCCRWSGENIASGYPTPHMVFNDWMRSPGHRANILKPEYTHTGVGYFYAEQSTFNHYWTQEFGELI